METIIINNEAYSKNVELINSFGFICTWEIINKFEFNIQTVADIKSALERAIVEAKEMIEVTLAQYEENKDFDFDGYYMSSYEHACETWSCLGLDLDKLSN